MYRLTQRTGFTIVELLVVLAIIGVMMGVLLPAMQKVRESANRVRCSNNLRQIGLALHNYEAQNGEFPPAGDYPVGQTSPDTYSVHARILPYLEQAVLYQLVDLNAPAISQPTIVRQRIGVYLCPDEITDRARDTSIPVRYPLSYAANVGSWFVYDPNKGQGGDGAIPINLATRPADFTDGLSNTIGFAEVKTYGSYFLGNGVPNTLLAPPPTSPAALLALGGSLKASVSHTGWTEGQTFQTGFTFVFTPNAPVPYTDPSGQTNDVDYVSSRDGSSATRLSFAAMTARSYHSAGTINVLFMDGSVRSIGSNIDLATWRALGTRAGGEVANDI
jgi:prepilin-type N-terminal cleavage/methylation domain-containing protein/prepilin-type processing-associated H-X9-DG protein